MDRRSAALAMQPGGASGAWTIDVRAQHLARETMAHASPALRDAVRAGNWWGGPGVIYAGVTVWLVARWMARARVAVAAFRGVESLAVASALSGILKGFAGRARPFVAPGEPWHFELAHGWTDANYFSMPSGHVTATTAFVCGVWFGTAREGTAGRAAVIMLLSVSVAWVAASRVASDQHWLSDTLVGVLLGALASAAVAALRRGRAPTRYDRIAVGRPAALEVTG